MVRGEPQLLLGTQSVGGILPLLGVPPLLGRLITEADEDAAAPGTVVLSYESWRDIFGDDRAAIGKSVTMNGTPRTVVGVMPPAFSFLGERSAFYVPARFDAKASHLPSGDQRGEVSRRSPEVKRRGSVVPSSAATQTALRYSFASRSTSVTV